MASTRRSSRASRRAPGLLPPPKAVQQQRQKSASRDSSVFEPVQTPAQKCKGTPTPKNAQQRNAQAQSRAAASQETRTRGAAKNRKHTQVVVGNGMVGQRLVELCADKLEERGASDQVDIVSFCEERLAAYNRVRFTSWFETRDADDLSLVGSYKDAPQGEWYATEERPNCKVRVGDLATGLDVDKKTVACGDELVSYDKCVLATGSYPFVPPIPGKDLPGVFVYRTIDDLEALVAYQKAHGARAARNFFFAATAPGREKGRGGASTTAEARESAMARGGAVIAASSPRPSSAAASSASRRPRPCTIWA